MRSVVPGWCGVALLIAALGTAQAAEIRGEIKLTSRGKALRASAGQDAVIYFRSQSPPALQPPETPYVLATEGKKFVPEVLPIVAGSTVRFPNNDPILHNAFSTSRSNAFDVGLYGQGEESEPVRFLKPGLVRVYCNVHHSMVAHVVVLDTPYFVVPNERGQFRLSDLPDGPGELLVWHGRSTLWRQKLDLGDEVAEVQVQMELSRRRVSPHLNKFGKPYRRSRRSDY